MGVYTCGLIVFHSSVFRVNLLFGLIYAFPPRTGGNELTDAMMISKIKYIHHNPLKRGYVDEASHWRYSSARDYEGVDGLLEVERFW